MTAYAKASIAAAFAVLLTATAAPAQQTDPLTCARTVDGAPIRIGDEVVDAKGQRIGAVSITQCSQPAEAGKLKVALDESRGGQVKVIDLDGARAAGITVYLAKTAEEIAPLANLDPAATPRSGS